MSPIANTGGFSPCPGCGDVGFTVQVWTDGEQLMHCDNADCRTHEYHMIDPEGANCWCGENEMCEVCATEDAGE